MAKESFFSRIKQLLEHVDDTTKTATTLTAAASKGATSVTVAAITGITNGATIRIGSGELCEWNRVNGAPSGNTVTLQWPLGMAHGIGEQAIPGITYDFGDPEDGGVKPSIDLGSTDVMLSTKRTAYTIIRDYMTATVEWARPAFTLQDLASALGVKQTRVTGAGATSSPYQLVVDGTQLGEDINRGVVVIGTLADGSDFFLEFHGVDKDYTVFKSTLRQGQLGSIPHKAVASSQIIAGTTAPAYTVDVSKRATKGKVFSAPSEFGVYSANVGLVTTLSADAAAGSTAFTAASTTGGAVGDRVLLSSGDDSEILIVATVADATHFTTRTPTNYPHLNGTAAVEQQQVPFGDVTEEGLDITIGGSTKDVPLAVQRMKGIVPATASLQLGFNLGAMKLSNIAYALGAPQTDISGGRIALNSNVGTSDIPAAYFRGLNQGGGTIEVNAFGITQDIKGIAPTLSAKDVAKLPLTLRPCTLQFLQY